ncbi:MAG: transcriptional repressor [Anaerolineae bacterium]|jgi:Fe2+ or Zn2+ uptake regulation protein|nr:transcriptional repressor [Anaerolineae bacterium]MDH7474518.1 transcriptional repressor [Anaerolineae bacterium]
MDESDKKMLRRAGKRITSQRMLVLEAIREGGGHLDADEIYRRAKLQAPRLSLSTVYRTINTLKEAGMIEELHLGEEHHHYELRDAKVHHHFVCQNCGRVVEFEWPFSEQLLRDLGEKYDFELTEIHLDLVGYCAECRRKKTNRNA